MGSRSGAPCSLSAWDEGLAANADHGGDVSGFQASQRLSSSAPQVGGGAYTGLDWPLSPYE